MLCKNPDCGIYQLTYDAEYDSDKNPDCMECPSCGSILTKTGADIIEGGLGGLIKEKRPAQIEYVKKLDQQFAKKTSVTFIEGGTGVGKSFAYLAPTILDLVKHPNERAIIVTANKALQTQLTRDIPLVLKAVGAAQIVSYALLKGRNNYACPLLITEVPTQFKKTFDKFVSSTLQGISADLDNWPTDDNLWWWGKVSTNNCPRPNNCKINCHNSAALQARLIITNYHYFGACIKFPNIVPFTRQNIKFLILDEAHQAAPGLRNALHSTISPQSLKNISADMQNSDLKELLRDHKDTHTLEKIKDIPSILDQISETLTQQLQEADKNTYKPKTQTSKPKGPPKYGFSAIILKKVVEHLDQLGLTTDLKKNLWICACCLKGGKISNTYFDVNPHGCIVHSRLISRIEKLTASLSEAHNEKFYVTKTAALDPRGICLLPVDIGAIIQPQLNFTFKHVVVTSATLAQNKTDFSYIKNTLGYTQPKDNIVEKVVGSPFNYDLAARLYIPRLNNIPAKGNFLEWYGDIAEEIINLAKASNGNGFVLFSSAKDLRETHNRTKDRLAKAGIPVLTQQDGISASLLNKNYLSTPNSMLYGLRSFWEGVDIQGSKLQLVIIPKLPFPVPDDPIIQTLTTRAGTTSFHTVTLPIMLESLRQGVGRLIRTKTDTGLIAILDSRFWSGNSNLTKHKTAMNTINNSLKKVPKGYGVRIFHSLGLKLIDTQSYACKLLKEIK